MIISHIKLQQLIAKVFERVGCSPIETGIIAKHLVEANLTGHDSHGVIRVSYYVRWLREQRVFANRHVDVVVKCDSFAVLDGQFGFGQVLGEEAVAIGIEMANKNGLGIVGLRNSGHLGRIGDWAEMAGNNDLISIHFVNGNGYAILVAPFGGADKRLSSNPICVGVPRGNKPAVILDMATSKFSYGKIMLAKNKGENLPEDIVLDSKGNPSIDPDALLGEPGGAILPLSPGHKGFGLSFICEILAGALTGGDTSNPESPTVHCVGNGMLSIYIDQKRFGDNDKFLAEIEKLTAWVKASPTVTPNGEIFLPGEPEYRTRKERLENGIPLDEETWRQFVETAKSLGIKDEELVF